jgi:hypothetical protein
VLRDFPWPRLRSVVALQLVAADPTPAVEVLVSHAGNVASIVRLQVDGSPRRDNTTTQLPYELGRDGTGGLIYCDQSIDDGITLQYVFAETTIAKWTPDMREVLVNLLASKIAVRFGPNAVKLGMTAYQLYERRRLIAWALAANEEVPDQPGDGDFIRARDGSISSGSWANNR